LELYARWGGIQRFNRRVVEVLGAASGSGSERIVVHSLNDQIEDVPPAAEGLILESYSRHRVRFFCESILTALRSDILILGHINLVPIAFVAKLLKPRLRTLLFAHGIEVWDTDAFRNKRFYGPHMLRASIDRVAAVSRYTADLICKRFDYPVSNVRILPNAVDPRDMTDWCDRDPQRLLTVCRLSAYERQKNVDKVIHAVAALKPRLPALLLEIVGDGELRSELEALVKTLGLEKNVRFLGELSDAELFMAYRRASVFVLPSVKEGFGIVYLEAWQQGLAVIGARAGAVPEVIEDEVDGILVDLEDGASSLGRAIERLARDEPLARQFGMAGRKKVEQLYLHSHFAARLNDILFGMAQHP